MALLDPSELYDDDFSDVDNMDFVGGGMEDFDPQDGPVRDKYLYHTLIKSNHNNAFFSEIE